MHGVLVMVLVTVALSGLVSCQEQSYVGIGQGYVAPSEGDIILSREQENNFRFERTMSSDPDGPQFAVALNPDRRWSGGTVPYTIASQLGTTARNAIQSAMADYVHFTCVSFVPRTTQTDYVEFILGGGCYSNVGRTRGRQAISIGRGCETKGIVIHEIFHALGRWHEQSRPDRDLHVRILTQNIRSGMESNFEKANERTVTTNGIAYDLDSVMHYSSGAFSSNGRPTILPVSPSVDAGRLGNRKGFTSDDIAHVNALYRCPGTGGDRGAWSSWSGWSSCSRDCNGGSQTRSRQCVGGTGCEGSNVGTRSCNTQACVYASFWSSWGSWSGCSRSCDSGQRVRSRVCYYGSNCPGAASQYSSCNTAVCPSTSAWSGWSAWAPCSRTCQGGSQLRGRRCRDRSSGELRYDCAGEDQELRTCNNGVTCATTASSQWSSWSLCSRQCGGGTRSRTRGCDSQGRGCQLQREECNASPCRPEPGLYGLTYEGCFYLLTSYSSLVTLEGSTADLSDHFASRADPLRKCGQAARQYNYTMLALVSGYCIVGNDRNEFYKFGSSSNCQRGAGDIRTVQYNGNAVVLYSMDVYRISNSVGFDASAADVARAEQSSGSLSSSLPASLPALLALLLVPAALGLLV